MKTGASVIMETQGVCLVQGEQRGGQITTSTHVKFITLKGYLYTLPRTPPKMTPPPQESIMASSM